jgi:hypothetical protein
VCVVVVTTTSAFAETSTVWDSYGLRVEYTHDANIQGLLRFENVTSHSFNFACSFSTKEGIGEEGRRLRPHRHHYVSGLVSETGFGGKFDSIGCAVSQGSWPRLPLLLFYEYWRDGRIEFEYVSHHVVIFNRVHAKTSYRSCRWTTGNGGRLHQYPDALKLRPYTGISIHSAEPDLGSVSC